MGGRVQGIAGSACLVAYCTFKRHINVIATIALKTRIRYIYVAKVFYGNI